MNCIFASRLVVVQKLEPISGGASFMTVADTNTKCNKHRHSQNDQKASKNSNNENKDETSDSNDM